MNEHELIRELAGEKSRFGRTASTLHMLLSKAGSVWRAEYRHPDLVQLMYIGFPDKPNSEVRKIHPDELPPWVQDRIAALNVLGDDFPTVWVDGVGRRISREIYYVEE